MWIIFQLCFSCRNVLCSTGNELGERREVKTEILLSLWGCEVAWRANTARRERERERERFMLSATMPAMAFFGARIFAPSHSLGAAGFNFRSEMYFTELSHFCNFSKSAIFVESDAFDKEGNRSALWGVVRTFFCFDEIFAAVKKENSIFKRSVFWKCDMLFKFSATEISKSLVQSCFEWC